MVLAFVAVLARPLRMGRFTWRPAIAHRHLRTRPVLIELLPDSVEVFEGKPFVHEFTVPADASNAVCKGEFTVEPRPQGHVNMLVVTAAGLQQWRQLFSSGNREATRDVSASGGVLYHASETIAESFEVKLAPGTYDVVFEFSGSADEPSDHYGGDGIGVPSRDVRSRIALSYDLPNEEYK